MSNKEVKYNQVVKGHYLNDPDRMDYDQSNNAARRAEALGYYSGKIISGYLVGYVIGAIFAFVFLYYYIVKPFILPFIKVFMRALY